MGRPGLRGLVRLLWLGRLACLGEGARHWLAIPATGARDPGRRADADDMARGSGDEAAQTARRGLLERRRLHDSGDADRSAAVASARIAAWRRVADAWPLRLGGDVGL